MFVYIPIFFLYLHDIPNWYNIYSRYNNFIINIYGYLIKNKTNLRKGEHIQT